MPYLHGARIERSLDEIFSASVAVLDKDLVRAAVKSPAYGCVHVGHKPLERIPVVLLYHRLVAYAGDPFQIGLNVDFHANTSIHFAVFGV